MKKLYHSTGACILSLVFVLSPFLSSLLYIPLFFFDLSSKNPTTYSVEPALFFFFPPLSVFHVASFSFCAALYRRNFTKFSSPRLPRKRPFFPFSLPVIRSPLQPWFGPPPVVVGLRALFPWSPPIPTLCLCWTFVCEGSSPSPSACAASPSWEARRP